MWSSPDVTVALKRKKFDSFWNANGVSIDSRTIQPNDIYVAIKGLSHDGHDFVEHAYKNGAFMCIVEKKNTNIPDSAQIIVPHTLQALEELARYSRNRAEHVKIVGVTGSVGKTSTKEMIAQVFLKLGKTAYSPKSFNNHWGVPYSLSNMAKDADYGVFEMGMNNLGEMAPLSRMIRPHVGIITKIGEGHIQHLKTKDAIASEKSDIFSGLIPGGAAILNKDDEYFDFLSDRAKTLGASEIISFGQSPNSDVRLIDYNLQTRKIKANVCGLDIDYSLNFIGLHQAINSLSALASFHYLGLDVIECASILSNASQIQGRGRFEKTTLYNGCPLTVYDESYNANPTSMKASLSILANLSTPYRKIAVIGDMRELGDNTKQYHIEIGQILDQYLKNNQIQGVITYGEQMKSCYDELSAHIGPHVNSIDEIQSTLEKLLIPNDVVLFKASLSMKLFDWLQKLLRKEVA
jgi:UDP-N-acetylmuramoyl-tripeptide--D-alanyl-D-alanine ligase